MMTVKFKNTNDRQKEVYFYLGLLSTFFAKMESKLLDILGKYITSDFVLANTLFERNSLHQNIEMLKSINSIREFEDEIVKKIIHKISSMRKTRNLFIHGIWDEPYESENDIFIVCRESKLDYTEEKANGQIVSRGWKSKKTTEFRLSYIRKLVDIVEEILIMEDHLLQKLEDYNYSKDF